MGAILDASYQNHHSAGTLIHCSCLISNDSDVQTEMAAVEIYIDVGNMLWVFYNCLYYHY